MKKTALIFAVAAMLGVVMVAGPVFAQDHDNVTTISTANSAFFGYRPTEANIQTFMSSTVSANCTAPDAAGSMICSPTSYVRNSQMPGSFTDRPDTGGTSLSGVVAISVNPDFGCGAFVTGGAAGALPCDESTVNLHDRVNGNFNSTTGAAGAEGTNNNNGQNTAPTAAPAAGRFTGGTAGGVATSAGVDGTLVGDFNSYITMTNIDGAGSGMPSGSVLFHLGPGAYGARQATIDQTVNVDVAGLFTFSEHDVTGASFTAGTGRTSGGGAAIGTYIPAGGLNIQGTLDLAQAPLGGDGVGPDEVVNYTTTFQGNGTYPIAGMFFTPGLGVADWNNSPAVDGDGFPN